MTALHLMIGLSIVAAVLGAIDFYRNRAAAATIAIDWRGLLARLPLPMLALAASYGVYSFALLFVPAWVAIVQAAAFELTYVGLAVTQGLDVPQRKRATGISVGAVVASIVYNTLAGWFYVQPQLLVDATAIAWLCLAILHGAPLAWVAYLVADLLLHTAPAAVTAASEENGRRGAGVKILKYSDLIPPRPRSMADRMNRRRRAMRLRENGGSFTETEWRDLCARYNNRCLRCGQQRKLTADHVIPLALGGGSNIDNIQPLCLSCNSSKGKGTEDYRDQPHADCAAEPPEIPSRKTIPVDPKLFAAYTLILETFDRDPNASTADLAAATAASKRTIESRRAELIRLGALHRTPEGYRRNGVELVAE